MTNCRFTPLSPREVQAFKNALKQSNNPIKELTGRLLLHTGMRNGEYIHLRPSWLSEDDGHRIIAIPEEEECIKGVGSTSAGNEKETNRSERGSPCTKCRNKPHRQHNRWQVQTPAAIRKIQIGSSQGRLIELLDWWQQEFDIVPLSHRGVNYHLKNLAEEAGLSRPVTAHDLRFTHGVILGQKGWTAPQILERLGYSSLKSAERFTVDPM